MIEHYLELEPENNRDPENSQIANNRKCFLFVYILAQCRSEEVGSEHGPIPSPAFFHPRLCTTDQPGQSAIPRTDCVRVNSPDVRHQEHDGCL